MLFEKIHLDKDEKVIRIVRKHWFYLFTRTFGVICAAILPFVAWLFFNSYGVGSSSIQIHLENYTSHFVYLYSLWLLLAWMMLAYIATDHYLDVWAITDRRIIAIEQLSLFRRHIGSFRLERLQDMNVEIDGIVATLLHFGTIEAQTASGSEEEFRAHFIPQPRDLKAVILEAADNLMRENVEESKITE